MDFDVKRRFFRQELDKIKEKNSRGDMAINVSRNQIFDDSFRTAFNLETESHAIYTHSFDFGTPKTENFTESQQKNGNLGYT